jgi:hypothetical protein
LSGCTIDSFSRRAQLHEWMSERSFLLLYIPFMDIPVRPYSWLLRQVVHTVNFYFNGYNKCIEFVRTQTHRVYGIRNLSTVLIVAGTVEDQALCLCGWVLCWEAYPCWQRRLVSPWCWLIWPMTSTDLGTSSKGILRLICMNTLNVKLKIHLNKIVVFWGYDAGYETSLGLFPGRGVRKIMRINLPLINLVLLSDSILSIWMEKWKLFKNCFSTFSFLKFKFIFQKLSTGRCTVPLPPPPETMAV